MARLIDADALLKALNEKGAEYRADINAEIMNAPAVDAEPVRHGKWIDGDDSWVLGAVTCSRCGAWSETATKYCGNCGAKMKGADDE